MTDLKKLRDEINHETDEVKKAELLKPLMMLNNTAVIISATIIDLFI